MSWFLAGPLAHLKNLCLIPQSNFVYLIRELLHVLIRKFFKRAKLPATKTHAKKFLGHKCFVSELFSEREKKGKEKRKEKKEKTSCFAACFN
jgi:hypothetical protein